MLRKRSPCAEDSSASVKLQLATLTYRLSTLLMSREHHSYIYPQKPSNATPGCSSALGFEPEPNASSAEDTWARIGRSLSLWPINLSHPRLEQPVKSPVSLHRLCHVLCLAIEMGLISKTCAEAKAQAQTVAHHCAMHPRIHVGLELMTHVSTTRVPPCFSRDFIRQVDTL